METFKRIVIALISAALIAIVGLAGIVGATTYEVDTVSDTTSAGHCTLRAALSASQGHPDSASSCRSVGSGDDTISFAPSLADQTILLTTELPLVSRGTVTIEGPAGGITLSGGNTQLSAYIGFRALTLTNLTFTNSTNTALILIGLHGPPATVTIKNCTFSNDGEAIQTVAAGLTIVSSTITNIRSSAAIDARGVTEIDGSTFSNNVGAALSASKADPTLQASLTIANSTFSNNGSGVGSSVEQTTIEDSFFSGNQNRAFSNASGTAQVNNTTFAENIDGVFNNQNGKISVTGCTFTANRGIAVFNNGTGSGGAETEIINSTFIGNGAMTNLGGAISNSSGHIDADFCTFSNNGAHTFYSTDAVGTITTLRGNVVSASPGATNCFSPSGSPFPNRGYNIFSDSSCPPGSDSLSNTDPQLDPAGLGNHGGPTLTIALAPSSPAVTFVPSSQCVTEAPDQRILTVDQRGFGRPAPIHSGFCSAGAFESGAVAPPPGASNGGGISDFPPPPLLGRRIFF